jgi:SMC interacting uncharacterized protein involved in chromosome segregation
MDTLIRIGEVMAGVVPFLIGFIVWVYKKGIKDQASEAKIEGLVTATTDLGKRMTAIEGKEDDLESDIKKVTTSMQTVTNAASSGVRPMVENAKVLFDQQIGLLHEKVNKLTAELHAKINTDTRDVLDAIATLRTDVDIIKDQFARLFDALSAIEVNVTSVLKAAEGEKVRIEGLEKWRATTETNLREIDKSISALKERTSRK